MTATTGACVRAVCWLALVAAWPAHAQRAGAGDEEESGLKMRESVSRPLADVQECIETEDFECARSRLERLRGRDDLYAYEEALVWRFYAFLHFEQDDTPGAIRAFENLLAVPDVPGGLEQESALTLAQLYAQQERFAEALSVLERWFSLVEEPAPAQYYFKAQLFYQMQRYAEGIPPLELAVSLAEAAGREPEEAWYNLLRLFYFETGEEAKLLDVVRTLLETWPKKEYLMHLAGLYGERDELDRQLALVEAAYDAGWLDTGSELASYASMLLAAEIPFKAASVLEAGLEAGTIEPTEQHWRMLGGA